MEPLEIKPYITLAKIQSLSADINNDGMPDLVMTHERGNTVSLMLGNGDGTFKPEKFYNVEYSPVSLTVSDFNNDGKLDLAVTSQYADKLFVFLNTCPS